MSFADSLKSLVTFGSSDLRAQAQTTKLEARQAAVSGLLIPGFTNNAAWPSNTLETYQRFHQRLALAYRCVATISSAIAQAHIQVKANEEKDSKTIANHPMRQLMVNPNPTLRENGFLARVGANAAATGFCVIQKVRSGQGRVVSLWPLRSDRLRAYPRPFNRFDWEYLLPGQVRGTLIPHDDAIVFTYADSLDFSPFGLGPMEVALREAALLQAMGSFVWGFFNGGAVPLLGIIPNLEPGETLDQEEIDALDEKFAAKHLGLQNAIRPIWLQGVKDIKTLGFDMNQLAYVDLRDLSELAICTAFGVAPEMMGVRAGLEHSDSRANAAVGRKGFYLDTIKPLWDRLDDVLTLGLLSEFEEPSSPLSLSFDTSDIPALQEDRNERAQWVLDLGSRGFASQYQVFDELGIPRPSTPDFYLRPISVEALPVDDPLGLQAAADAQAQADAIAAGQALPALPPGQPAADASPPADQPAARASFWTLDTRASGPESFLAWSSPRMIELLAAGGPGEVRAHFGIVGRKEMAKVARRAKPLIQGFLTGQLNRIVKRITALGPEDEPLPVMPQIPWDQELAALSRTANKIYLMAGEAAYAQIEAATGIGMSFNLANPHVHTVLDKVATRPKGIRGVSQETQTKVDQLIHQGMAQGLTNKEIAKTIRGLYQETYRNRSETIARTESMVSYGYAQAEGFRETGLVDRIQCFDNATHTEDYGAEDGLTCATRDGFVDSLDSAELHVNSEHPNGSLTLTPVLAGEAI